MTTVDHDSGRHRVEFRIEQCDFIPITETIFDSLATPMINTRGMACFYSRKSELEPLQTGLLIYQYLSPYSLEVASYPEQL